MAKFVQLITEPTVGHRYQHDILWVTYFVEYRNFLKAEDYPLIGDYLKFYVTV